MHNICRLHGILNMYRQIFVVAAAVRIVVVVDSGKQNLKQQWTIWMHKYASSPLVFRDGKVFTYIDANCNSMYAMYFNVDR